MALNYSVKDFLADCRVVEQVAAGASALDVSDVMLDPWVELPRMLGV